MKRIKAIIVDDEQDARDVLQTLIGMSPVAIDVIAQCENVLDAVSLIKSEKPDVVFLDVQMPNHSGYEIVKFFDKIEFEIIFVTAYDKYAIKAFELSAIDYLVKPIGRDRLNASLSRLQKKVEGTFIINEYQVLLDSLKEKEFHKIVIPELGGKRILLLKDIICIQGKGSYTSIFLVGNEKEVVVSKNLKYFENFLLDNSQFFRSQKSWIVNLNQIEKYNSFTGDLIMSNGVTARLSRGLVEEFEFLMKD